MKSIRINIAGKTFGRLKVISYSHTNKDRKACWNCVCVCGKKTVASGKGLRTKNVQSCGCLKLERCAESHTIHGGRYDELYEVWSSMLKRCRNINCKAYKNYGGRGINVLWKDYQEFRGDMEISYKKHKKKFGDDTELERKNNDSNYSKENCKWVTRKEQANNKRTNHNLTFNGKTQNLKQWSNELKIPYQILTMRIWRGWSTEKALKYKK